MRFSRIGELEVVTRIIGPHHHFLGLALSTDAKPSAPILERVELENPEATVEPAEVGAELRREVVEAVSAANRRLGTHFTVTRIRYCGDDPAVPGVRGQLAGALVERVAQEQKNPEAKRLAPTVP